jgi:phosphoglycolate phosphatase-like HAD superfamily hydrolase
MRIVLWDVDGTLLLNGGRAGRLYDDAIQDVTGFEPGGQRPAEHGKTDAQIITERLAEYGLDTGLLAAVRERLDDLSEAGNAGEYARRLAPGVVPALEAIAAAGWRNGVLTGNSPARVRHKFTGAGLDLDLFDWDHAYYGHETTVRSDIARRARAELEGAPAVIIGDTPSDGEAAAAAGIHFVAVATGAFDEGVLRGTAAALVVPDLEQGLPSVLATLEALAPAPTPDDGDPSE